MRCWLRLWAYDSPIDLRCRHRRLYGRVNLSFGGGVGQFDPKLDLVKTDAIAMAKHLPLDPRVIDPGTVGRTQIYQFDQSSPDLYLGVPGRDRR